MLATLPLEEGYSTALRNLNLQTQSVRPDRLAVVGSEQLTVPAGTFDAFIVELTSPDDSGRTTFWVAKDTRRVLKTVATGPQLNGATVTAELAE